MMYFLESVLNVLTRVYKEEWNQSIELATNIVYIFFCFSSFTDFHPLVSQYRIGAQTMTVIVLINKIIKNFSFLFKKIVEAEMKKYDQWMDEINREQKKKARDQRSNITIDNKYKVLIRKQEQFLRGEILLKIIS
jgi:ABC-type iron transport system FetAB permease component